MSREDIFPSTSNKPKVSTPTIRSGRWREILPYLDPAFLISVGYMDPGNWGTDIDGGARFNAPAYLHR